MLLDVIYRFKREQKVFKFGNITLGGKPGKNPPVLIGSIFYENHNIVSNFQKGEFDKTKATRLIITQEDMSKKKGTRAERELIHMFFNSNEWMAVRAAGSGSVPLPCPDLIAGNGKRRLAIECKALSEPKKYFKEKEIQELIEFSEKFGAEAWIGIRFDKIGWFFLEPNKLQKSKKSCRKRLY